jgi:hypothetical protein
LQRIKRAILLKEKLLKKKTDDLSANPTTKDLVNNDLREIANTGVLPSLKLTLEKEDLNEKDYKALLKKQLEIGKQDRELKRKAISEQKSTALIEE